MVIGYGIENDLRFMKKDKIFVGKIPLFMIYKNLFHEFIAMIIICLA